MASIRKKAIQEASDTEEVGGDIPGEAMRANDVGRVLWADLTWRGYHDRTRHGDPRAWREPHDCSGILMAICEQGRRWAVRRILRAGWRSTLPDARRRQILHLADRDIAVQSRDARKASYVPQEDDQTVDEVVEGIIDKAEAWLGAGA